MVKILKVIVLIFIVILFSCEKQGLIVMCSECTKDEPLNIILDVKLDKAGYYYATKINVYEGNLEDSVLYYSTTTSWSGTTIPVTINKKYTITASYFITTNYYVVVDAVTPRVRYEKDQCEEPCYFVYDKDVDLRLKGR